MSDNWPKQAKPLERRPSGVAVARRTEGLAVERVGSGAAASRTAPRKGEVPRQTPGHWEQRRNTNGELVVVWIQDLFPPRDIAAQE